MRTKIFIAHSYTYIRCTYIRKIKYLHSIVEQSRANLKIKPDKQNAHKSYSLRYVGGRYTRGLFFWKNFYLTRSDVCMQCTIRNACSVISDFVDRCDFDVIYNHENRRPAYMYTAQY